MPRQLALGLLMLFHLGFWLVFGQLSQVVIAVIGKHGLLLIAALVAALAPAVLALWGLLGRHALAPSTTAKFSLGFVLLAVSWFCLGVHFEWSRAAGPGHAPLIACASLMLALAALSLGPASLTAIIELEAREHRPAWLAVGLLGLPLAMGSSSWIGASAALDERVEICALAGLLCVLAGVVLAFVWQPITNLAGSMATMTQMSGLRIWRVAMYRFYKFSRPRPNSCSGEVGTEAGTPRARAQPLLGS